MANLVLEPGNQGRVTELQRGMIGQTPSLVENFFSGSQNDVTGLVKWVKDKSFPIVEGEKNINGYVLTKERLRSLAENQSSEPLRAFVEVITNALDSQKREDPSKRPLVNITLSVNKSGGVSIVISDMGDLDSPHGEGMDVTFFSKWLKQFASGNEGNTETAGLMGVGAQQSIGILNNTDDELYISSIKNSNLLLAGFKYDKGEVDTSLNVVGKKTETRQNKKGTQVIYKLSSETCALHNLTPESMLKYLQSKFGGKTDGDVTMKIVRDPERYERVQERVVTSERESMIEVNLTDKVQINLSRDKTTKDNPRSEVFLDILGISFGPPIIIESENLPKTIRLNLNFKINTITEARSSFRMSAEIINGLAEAIQQFPYDYFPKGDDLRIFDSLSSHFKKLSDLNNIPPFLRKEYGGVLVKNINEAREMLVYEAKQSGFYILPAELQRIFSGDPKAIFVTSNNDYESGDYDITLVPGVEVVKGVTTKSGEVVMYDLQEDVFAENIEGFLIVNKKLLPELLSKDNTIKEAALVKLVMWVENINDFNNNESIDDLKIEFSTKEKSTVTLEDLDKQNIEKEQQELRARKLYNDFVSKVPWLNHSKQEQEEMLMKLAGIITIPSHYHPSFQIGKEGNELFDYVMKLPDFKVQEILPKILDINEITDEFKLDFSFILNNKDLFLKYGWAICNAPRDYWEFLLSKGIAQGWPQVLAFVGIDTGDLKKDRSHNNFGYLEYKYGELKAKQIREVVKASKDINHWFLRNIDKFGNTDLNKLLEVFKYHTGGEYSFGDKMLFNDSRQYKLSPEKLAHLLDVLNILAVDPKKFDTYWRYKYTPIEERNYTLNFEKEAEMELILDFLTSKGKLEFKNTTDEDRKTAISDRTEIDISKLSVLVGTGQYKAFIPISEQLEQVYSDHDSLRAVVHPINRLSDNIGGSFVEVIKNSLQAIGRSLGKGETISSNVVIDDYGEITPDGKTKYIVEVQDKVGMDVEEAIIKLGVSQIGEGVNGVGFMKLLSDFDEVVVETSNGVKSRRIIFTPVRNDGEVVDVKLGYEDIGVVSRGTKVRMTKYSNFPVLEAEIFRARVRRFAATIPSRKGMIFWKNSEGNINSEVKQLCSFSTDLGEMAVNLNNFSTVPVVTVEDIEIKNFDLVEVINSCEGIPKPVAALLSKTPFSIELDSKKARVTGDGSGFSNTMLVTKSIRDTLNNNWKFLFSKLAFEGNLEVGEYIKEHLSPRAFDSPEELIISENELAQLPTTIEKFSEYDLARHVMYAKIWNCPKLGDGTHRLIDIMMSAKMGKLSVEDIPQSLIKYVEFQVQNNSNEATVIIKHFEKLGMSIGSKITKVHDVLFSGLTGKEYKFEVGKGIPKRLGNKLSGNIRIYKGGDPRAKAYFMPFYKTLHYGDVVLKELVSESLKDKGKALKTIVHEVQHLIDGTPEGITHPPEFYHRVRELIEKIPVARILEAVV